MLVRLGDNQSGSETTLFLALAQEHGGGVETDWLLSSHLNSLLPLLKKLQLEKVKDLPNIAFTCPFNTGRWSMVWTKYVAVFQLWSYVMICSEIIWRDMQWNQNSLAHCDLQSLEENYRTSSWPDELHQRWRCVKPLYYISPALNYM